MPRQYPASADALHKLAGMLKQARKGEALDPLRISSSLGLNAGETLALLNVLSKQNFGSLLLRVADDRGLEIGRYESVQEIPPVIENEFGDRFTVTPENVEVVFVPSAK